MNRIEISDRHKTKKKKEKKIENTQHCNKMK